MKSEQIIDTNTYLYDGKEVRKTGRIARKTLRSGKIHTLYEIEPISVEGKKWSKFVDIEDLYRITSENGTNEN